METRWQVVNKIKSKKNIDPAGHEKNPPKKQEKIQICIDTYLDAQENISWQTRRGKKQREEKIVQKTQ